MARITNFMYGLIIIGVIAAGFGLYFAGIADSYGLEYDNETLDAYNQLDDLHGQTENIQDKTTEVKEKTGALDVIGSYFSSGYRVLVITKGSFDTYDTISSEAIDKANLGVFGTTLKIALGSMILIFIFIGVILSAIIKRTL